MTQPTTKKPRKIYYDPLSVAKRTKQVVHFVEEHDKAALLEHIIKHNGNIQSVVLTKNKRQADELNVYLKNRDIKVMAIHGNHRAEAVEMSQKAFNSKELNVIITTDKILESLCLNNIPLIINFDLPIKAEHYLVRLVNLQEIGKSISLVSQSELALLNNIEFLLKQDIPKEEVKDFLPSLAPEADKAPESIKEKKKKPRHRAQKQKKVVKPKE